MATVPGPFISGVLTMNRWVDEASDEQRIQVACGFNGGWEVWAQIELAHWWQHNNKQLKVEREKYSYSGSSQRSDLELTSSTDVYTIELKCKTRAETGSQFGSRLNDDFNKLKSVTPVVPIGLTSNKWVYGILSHPISPDAPPITDTEKQRDAVTNYLKATPLTGVDTDKKYVQNTWYTFKPTTNEVWIWFCRVV